mmetsp:Transcript_8370/g.20842  ORF Transcript_8370/g.20842 Transcript_8370/m.20842 type:complete len:267 (-) Transcript_8370:519-1319(-)
MLHTNKPYHTFQPIPGGVTRSSCMDTAAHCFFWVLFMRLPIASQHLLCPFGGSNPVVHLFSTAVDTRSGLSGLLARQGTRPNRSPLGHLGQGGVHDVGCAHRLHDERLHVVAAQRLHVVQVQAQHAAQLAHLLHHLLVGRLVQRQRGVNGGAALARARHEQVQVVVRLQLLGHGAWRLILLLPDARVLAVRQRGLLVCDTGVHGVNDVQRLIRHARVHRIDDVQRGVGDTRVHGIWDVRHQVNGALLPCDLNVGGTVGRVSRLPKV